MSDFDDLKGDPRDDPREDLGADPREDPRDDGNQAVRDADADRAQSIGAESASAAAPVNPRKRKKSSRACDFCHVNHQPCDNAKPRCSYCERHNKSCLYLRPQKKRGPAQGYRSALHTLRESAAAWGAALNLIPSLGPVVEGYLKQPEGRRLIKAIKDPAQQEFFIQAWHQSGVFKAFFPDEAQRDSESASAQGASPTAMPAKPQALPVAPAAPALGLGPAPASRPAPMPTMPMIPVPMLSQPPVPDALSIPKLDNPFNFVPTPSPSQDGGRPRQPSMSSRIKPRQDSISFSDIVAKDAARSSLGFSQTLGSLGFAPNETLEDFLDMSFNPEPVEQPLDNDPALGSEQDQKAYYELLMGRRFG